MSRPRSSGSRPQRPRTVQPRLKHRLRERRPEQTRGKVTFQRVPWTKVSHTPAVRGDLARSVRSGWAVMPPASETFPTETAAQAAPKTSPVSAVDVASPRNAVRTSSQRDMGDTKQPRTPIPESLSSAASRGTSGKTRKNHRACLQGKRSKSRMQWSSAPDRALTEPKTTSSNVRASSSVFNADHQRARSRARTLGRR